MAALVQGDPLEQLGFVDLASLLLGRLALPLIGRLPGIVCSGADGRSDERIAGGAAERQIVARAPGR